MKQLYKVTLFGGYVGLIAAESIEAAKKQAMSEQGSANVQNVSRASEEDISWVKGMGGPVPGTETKLPSQWAREGYFVVESWRPKAGEHCDYYDRDGCKRQGTVKSYDGKTITIDGERKVILTETFNVRFGR